MEPLETCDIINAGSCIFDDISFRRFQRRLADWTIDLSGLHLGHSVEVAPGLDALWLLRNQTLFVFLN